MSDWRIVKSRHAEHVQAYYWTVVANEKAFEVHSYYSRGVLKGAVFVKRSGKEKGLDGWWFFRLPWQWHLNTVSKRVGYIVEHWREPGSSGKTLSELEALARKREE